MNNNVNMNLYMTNTTDSDWAQGEDSNDWGGKEEMTKEIEEINENMLNMLTTKELENELLLKQVESYKKDTAKCELAGIT